MRTYIYTESACKSAKCTKGYIMESDVYRVEDNVPTLVLETYWNSAGTGFVGVDHIINELLRLGEIQYDETLDDDYQVLKV